MGNIYVKELNEQGRVLFSSDKYEESVIKYQQAMDLAPMDTTAYFNCCESYIMMDQYDKAKKLMKKVLLLDKNNGQAHFHLGNIALLEENYDEGKLEYSKAVNCEYDSPQIYINLAALAEDNDDWEEALKMYNKAIARDKTESYARIRKIQIYMMANKSAEALRAADDLINTNVQIFEGHHFKFVILASENRLEEAEETLAKAERLFPDDQGFKFDRVKLLELQDKNDEALEILNNEKLDTIPQEVIITEKAKLYLAKNDIIKAKFLMEQYNDNPIVPEMKQTLISIYLFEKNYEGVIKTAEKILGLEEYDSYYFAALYYKAIATKHTQPVEIFNKTMNDTLKILQQACAVDGSILELYLYRAICYREVKNYDKASEMLDYISLLRDDIAEVHYIRSLIYKDLNDEDNEKIELEKVEKINPRFNQNYGIE